MFEYSFMNYYCVRRLLDEGASECDFVRCFIDTNGELRVYSLGVLPILMESLLFIGFSRRH